MPFIYHIMAEYTRQMLQKERTEKQILDETRVDYFMKKDIESINTAILTEFHNNKSRFQCKRHCSEEYIDYITQSLKLIFLDSTIFYNYNSEDNSYMLHIEWG